MIQTGHNNTLYYALRKIVPRSRFRRSSADAQEEEARRRRAGVGGSGGRTRRRSCRRHSQRASVRWHRWVALAAAAVAAAAAAAAAAAMASVDTAAAAVDTAAAAAAATAAVLAADAIHGPLQRRRSRSGREFGGSGPGGPPEALLRLEPRACRRSGIGIV